MVNIQQIYIKCLLRWKKNGEILHPTHYDNMWSIAKNMCLLQDTKMVVYKSVFAAHMVIYK